MLTGISRMQGQDGSRYHGVSPSWGQSWAEREVAELSHPNPPQPRAVEAGQQTSKPALSVRDPGAHHSKAGGCGSLVVPTAAVTHMLCSIRSCSSKPDQQPQHSMLPH